jgi:hypothetical protein
VERIHENTDIAGSRPMSIRERSGKFTRVGRIDGAIWIRGGHIPTYLKGADTPPGVGNPFTFLSTDTESDDCNY